MKTTIEMAREAAGDDWKLFQEFMPEIHRLAELVRADERARMAEQPAQQEPVACVGPWHDGRLTLIPRYSRQTFEHNQPLYASPQPAQRTWVALTDEEIDKTHETKVWDARRSYARAIEAKLRSKNEDRN